MNNPDEVEFGVYHRESKIVRDDVQVSLSRRVVTENEIPHRCRYQHCTFTWICSLEGRMIIDMSIALYVTSFND